MADHIYSPTILDQFGRSLVGGPQGYVRRPPEGDLQPTVFPLPVRPLSDITPQMRRQAIEATYTGRLQEAVDLYRQAVTEDGYISGILSTMAHGILGMPHSYQGDERMCEALDDAHGTPSEYTEMHPESECAQVFADGIGFGIGLGEYVYETDTREPGCNRVPRLEWRDPRWLWRNPISLQWYFTTRAGMRPINPGDGQWLLFQPYPDVDTWRHGPWLYITLAAIFARDAVFDRQRVSEVTTPTPVLRAQKPTSKEARKDALKQLQDLAHDHRVVLPEQWDYQIVSASTGYVDVAQSIVDWANGAVEVGLTGNMMGMKAQSAFTDANVYKRTTTDRRRFYAQAWCHAIRTQGLRYWALDNYGTTNAPIVRINVESPEDRLSESKAIEQEGKGIAALQEGYAAAGFELEPEWIVERAQAKGIRVRPRAASAGAAKLVLGVEQTAAVVRGAEARAAEGLPPFGDERDNMTIADLAAGPQADAPEQAAPEAEHDDGMSARLEDASRLADEMNEHSMPSCRHRRTGACARCGVEAVYRVVASDEGPVYRPTWRPMAARARKAAGDKLDAALAKLDAALAKLDALPPDDEPDDGMRGRYNPDQMRDALGRFAPVGGGVRSGQTAEGAHIVYSAGTKHGFGTSRAAGAARAQSTAAKTASAAAQAGGSHEAAAKAHEDAAEQHREAAKRSVRSDYKAAHEAAAKAHDDVAKEHKAQGEKKTEPEPAKKKSGKQAHFISTSDGSRIPVTPAIKGDHFFVHKTSQSIFTSSGTKSVDSFSITHKDSGMAAGIYGTKKEAEAALKVWDAPEHNQIVNSGDWDKAKAVAKTANAAAESAKPAPKKTAKEKAQEARWKQESEAQERKEAEKKKVEEAAATAKRQAYADQVQKVESATAEVASYYQKHGFENPSRVEELSFAHSTAASAAHEIGDRKKAAFHTSEAERLEDHAVKLRKQPDIDERMAAARAKDLHDEREAERRAWEAKRLGIGIKR